MSPRLVIVGPPGAGKTVTGRLLAERLGGRFRDTDADVEHRAGRPIPEIFTEQGEAAFRALEEEAVAEALAEHTGVLALGGGAVVSAATRQRLAEHPVLFLSVGLSEGVRRTGLSTPRPVLAGVNPRANFQALLRERLPLYREVADWEVDTDRLEPTAVVERVIRMTHTGSPGAGPG
ncbi:shikimate kinase [Actinopolyspora mortivallis]|uniref:shikimate kinase n=1 Tax=Actinopolyspora mortivallis TaxID=33906 RepID=UPI00036AF586|nr:shikimate kinase [Actinopolyspora mortivallis]